MKITTELTFGYLVSLATLRLILRDYDDINKKQVLIIMNELEKMKNVVLEKAIEIINNDEREAHEIDK